MIIHNLLEEKTKIIKLRRESKRFISQMPLKISFIHMIQSFNIYSSLTEMVIYSYMHISFNSISSWYKIQLVIQVSYNMKIWALV